MQCPNHNVEMTKRQSQFGNKWWWTCPMFPSCDMQATQEKNGRMIDYPAGQEIRDLRKKAHTLLDQIFAVYPTKCERTAMIYSFLNTRIKSGHIGLATKDELTRLIKLLEREIS